MLRNTRSKLMSIIYHLHEVLNRQINLKSMFIVLLIICEIMLK